MIMAELVDRVPQQDRPVQRLSMAEGFVMRNGLIRERPRMKCGALPPTPGPETP
jgi:hypothetical protein